LVIEGTVDDWYQRNDVESALSRVKGVQSLANLLSVKPNVEAIAVETKIRAAFERNALLDGNKIEITVSGNKVDLRGHARSHAERDEALRAARAAPGVAEISNHIHVNWFQVQCEYKRTRGNGTEKNLRLGLARLFCPKAIENGERCRLRFSGRNTPHTSDSSKFTMFLNPS
jgi:hypothetical protein